MSYPAMAGRLAPASRRESFAHPQRRPLLLGRWSAIDRVLAPTGHPSLTDSPDEPLTASNWIVLGALILSGVIASFNMRAQRRERNLENDKEAQRRKEAGD
jgi:hypothetical protein